MPMASAPSESVAPVDEVLFTRMRDGVCLVSDLYLARGVKCGPTVLIRTPYGRRTVNSPVPATASRLREAGFTVLVQDIRGQGQSTGQAIPFAHEIEDAGDTLDWLVRQSWSNGQVACWGNSYYGFTAWAAVATRHSAIYAMISRMTSVRPHCFAWQNGVLRLGPMTEWARTSWAPREALLPTAIDWSTRPLLHLIRQSRAQDFLLQRTDAWAALSRVLWAELGRVPTLHWVGWFDLFAAAQLEEWHAATRAGSMQYLIATASDHMDTVFDFSGRSPDPWTGSAARERWLDRTLTPVIDFLRSPPGLPERRAAVCWELAGAGPCQAASWPPAEVVKQTLYLGRATGEGGHGLQLQPGAAKPDLLGWIHDPDALVPWLDRDWWRPLLHPGDTQSWLARDDVLSFTADPASGPVDLAGPVVLRLAVRSTAAVYHLVVTLCDVDAVGVSRVLLQTPQRVATTHPSVNICLGDLGYQLAAGHRLRLHIASSCFPLYAPQSGDASDPWQVMQFSASHQTVDLSQCELSISRVPLPRLPS